MNKREFANAIRFLSLDAVEKAKSGHPGAPMGMADIAYVLWKKFLKHTWKTMEKIKMIMRRSIVCFST